MATHVVQLQKENSKANQEDSPDFLTCACCTQRATYAFASLLRPWLHKIFTRRLATCSLESGTNHCAWSFRQPQKLSKSVLSKFSICLSRPKLWRRQSPKTTELWCAQFESVHSSQRFCDCSCDSYCKLLYSFLHKLTCMTGLSNVCWTLNTESIVSKHLQSFIRWAKPCQNGKTCVI